MCWVARGSRGLPGEGGGVGTGARGLHKSPSGWMSHSPGEGGKKAGWGGGGTESSTALAFPKASAHLTDGDVEAWKVTGPCRGRTVQTGESWGVPGPAGGRQGPRPHSSFVAVAWFPPLLTSRAELSPGDSMRQEGVCPAESHPTPPGHAHDPSDPGPVPGSQPRPFLLTQSLRD